MSSVPSHFEVEQFLYREARLLDEKRWAEWQALYVEDGEYWVPASHDQPDPLNHVSIMYEKSLLRAVRLKRYDHPNAMSLQPVPRTVHTISNVMLDSYDPQSGQAIVNSRFTMLEFRRDTQNTYGGALTHTLVADGDSFLIQQKKVELINCEGILSNIQVYF